ncbi:MAG: 6-phosphogluconolactonase [Burkholderiales bacterium]|nr:6-phosphogluconolactonase [Burkholderiales bacterium]
MNLQIFSTQNEQIHACIEHIITMTGCILEKKSRAVFAVSGGKSPISLFKQLSQIPLDFSSITFTLVDERLTEVNSCDSNEYLVRENLLQHQAKSSNFIGLMNSSLSTQAMLNSANQTIPTIDLAILGMGEDGHTASIFPDCPELNLALDLANKNRYTLTNPISAKYSRISLTAAALIQIPHLILLINGNIKLNVLKEAILGDNLNYPISYILSRRPDIQIFWYE